VAACGGGSSLTAKNSSHSPDGTYSGHGAYINPIEFSMANATVTDVHGLVQLNCVGAAGTLMPQQSEFSDNDQIAVDTTGHFDDDYQYAVGNGTWTLHVEGSLASDGSATGFLSVLGVGCSTPTDGWAAALPGVTLPAIPTYVPPPPPACDPQPCGTQAGIVTVYVESTAAVTASDDPSVSGIDVTATFVSEGTNGFSIQPGDFEITFDNGDVADSSGHSFVDETGADVPCIRPGSGPVVQGGQQAADIQVCLALSGDESGQPMTLHWKGHAGPPVVVPLGAAP
jgi:hypothetical protein